MKPGFHNCPHPKCDREVSLRLFACRSHWFQLSLAVREAIYRTAQLGILHPDRRAAIRAAGEEWEANA